MEQKRYDSSKKYSVLLHRYFSWLREGYPHRMDYVGGTLPSSTPSGPKASGATFRIMLYAPLTSALMYRPSDTRYNPRFTRLPLKVCLVSSFWVRTGNGSRSRKLAFEV